LDNGYHKTNDTKETRQSSIEKEKNLHEDGPETSMLMSREFEEWSRLKSKAEASAYRIESKSLVVLQANCRSF